MKQYVCESTDRRADMVPDRNPKDRHREGAKEACCRDGDEEVITRVPTNEQKLDVVRRVLE